MKIPLFDDAPVNNGSDSFDFIPESCENEIENPLDSNKAETELYNNENRIQI